MLQRVVFRLGLKPKTLNGGAFDMDAHDPFQERELEATLLETKRELAAGKYVSESVADHIRRIIGEI